MRRKYVKPQAEETEFGKQDVILASDAALDNEGNDISDWIENNFNNKEDYS